MSLQERAIHLVVDPADVPCEGTQAWSEIVGTISGDDTIFVATAGVRQQQSLMVRLAQVFPKARQS